MNNESTMTERVVILMEPWRKTLLETIAQNDHRYRLPDGRASVAAVVRAATDLFFAQAVHDDEIDAIRVNDPA